MTVYLACDCSARDEVAALPAEPVKCWSCGRNMRAYTPPAWLIAARAAVDRARLAR